MKRSELALTLARVPVDFIALSAAALVAYYLRFHPWFLAVRPVIFELALEAYLSVAIPLTLVWLLLFAFSGLYAIRKRGLIKECSRVIFASSAAMALIFAISFFSRTLFESRFIALAAWGLSILFVCFGRLFIRGLQRLLIQHGIGVHRIAVIGQGPVAEELFRTFQQQKQLGFCVVAHRKTFDDSTAHALLQMKQRDEIDEIILADPEANREMTLSIIAFTDIQHLGFRFSADLFSAAVGRSITHNYAGIPVIEVQKTPLDGWGAIYKRLFDIVVSSVLILLSLPVQIIIAVALFLEQPGRILFSRTPDGKKTMRIGQAGKPFHYFKFRSMIKNAHAMRFDPAFLETHGNMRAGSPLFKLENDPRVTRVGRFIRQYSLDELPEFYLVLFGRMSLVGPRPHLPEEVQTYKPEYRKSFTIKPGITGLAQTSGRADLDFAEEIRLDTFYIEHWSPWLDLSIFLKTPFVVLFKKGAY